MFKKISNEKSWARLGAMAVAMLSANVFAQTAEVPVSVNVNASVTISPPPGNDAGLTVTHNVTAGTPKTFILDISSVSVAHRVRKQNSGAAMTHGRGGVSLKLNARQYAGAAISLHTVNGRRVMHGLASAGSGTFAVSRANLAKGIYLLSVKGTGGASFSTRMTHGGGKLNITAAFGGESVAHQKSAMAPVEFGEWTITASAPGHSFSPRKFRPTEGENSPQNLTLTPTTGPDCTPRNPDADLDLSKPGLGREFPIVVTFNEGGAPTVTVDPADEDLFTREITNGHVSIKGTVPQLTTIINVIVSGKTENGSLKIETGNRMNLYLNGVSIKNPNGSAIAIWGKRTEVNLVGGCDRKNFLESAGTYTPCTGCPKQEKGVLFSENTIDIKGGGYLEVKSAYNHAIVSDGNINVENADVVISESVADGIHANNDIEISSGKVYISSSGDAIQSERVEDVLGITITGGEVTLRTTGVRSHGLASEKNVYISGSPTININVSGAAAKGIRARQTVEIKGGTIDATTSGGIADKDDTDDPTDLTSSAAGIRAQYLEMSGGKFTTVNTGDNSKGINVDLNATISGGEVHVTAHGDGIKVDGNLTISGSNTKVYAKSETKKGIDCKGTRSVTSPLGSVTEINGN